ncbi:putative gnat family n-acetyltransferase protein [Neofusicoccum parvum UCRNP2]|uniref:Putative gnat family n-acetyltransferase protein n=1 Tax=Botryosphaeria parva (strain UCR-NP2) TaxID=1287680 RepID=R1FYF5_BOTPV|nr:putative gnat family n-acetyltransferase protein [Neofusicoccum parvum UCRNP2]
MPPSSSLTLRPARASDVPELHAINAHFVENTVLTFVTTPLSYPDFFNKYHSIRSSGLPYIVALDASADDPDAPIGSVRVSHFRGSQADAYRHTVELSLFCHPEHTGKGVGSALLTRLLDVLRRPEEWGEEWIGKEWCRDDVRVREVIGVMAVDDQSEWKGGLGLKEWYERFGFEEVGRLRRVGRKFGRW